MTMTSIYYDLRSALIEGAEEFDSETKNQHWLTKFFSPSADIDLSRAEKLKNLAEKIDVSTTEGQAEVLALATAVFKTNSTPLLRCIGEQLIDGEFAIVIIPGSSNITAESDLNSKVFDRTKLNDFVRNTDNLSYGSAATSATYYYLDKAIASRELLTELSNSHSEAMRINQLIPTLKAQLDMSSMTSPQVAIR